MQPEWKKGRSAFKILTGTPAGKSPLVRPMRRWEDNIRMDLKEIINQIKQTSNKFKPSFKF